MKLFLDDYRKPRDCIQYMYQRIGVKNTEYMEDWIIVKNYDEFVKAVSEFSDEIEVISFDHDLADEHYIMETDPDYSNYKERTGLDCAKWLLDFYKEKDKNLPRIYVHSMNPVGTDNIVREFEKGDKA